MLKRFLAILLPIGLILTLSSCPTGTTEASGNVVTIEGQTITSPTTWTSDNLYYVKSWVVFTSSLTIEPGTIVALGADATMSVEGQLNAIGTSGDPITFTSAKESFSGYTIPGVTGTPAMGDWDYIWIKGASSQLKHCSVRYSARGIEVAANSVTVQNDTLTYNAIGLDARSAGTGFIVGSNAFYGNTHPFYAGRNFSIDNSNTFNDGGSIKNTYQAIEFDSGDVDTNITWSCTTVAYAFPSWLTILNGFTLNLATNTVLKFGAAGTLTIDLGGTLNNYTNAEFTSIKDDFLLGDSNGDGSLTTPAPSDWDYAWDGTTSLYLTGGFLHYCAHP